MKRLSVTVLIDAYSREAIDDNCSEEIIENIHAVLDGVGYIRLVEIKEDTANDKRRSNIVSRKCRM